MFNLTRKSKIYIVAPPSIASGGPELLHQLCYELNQLHINAQMFYYDKNNPQKRYANPIPHNYYRYNVNYVEYIEDDENNLLIVPETITAPLKNYSSIKKCIWWLGANNYFWFNEDAILSTLCHWIRYILHLPVQLTFAEIKELQVYHLAQCWYLKKFVEQKGILNVGYLSDYINEDFINCVEQNREYEKRNIILYNPKRKQKLIKFLQRKNSALKFVPIKNMSQEEMRKLMCSAKLYIDLGRHPGKDRMPREAALCGCCILTSTLGSAGFYEDVPIPAEYKFDRKKENVPNILNKIQNVMDNYEKEMLKFEGYRNFIKNERNVFLADVKRLFQITDTEEINSEICSIN